MASAGYGWVVLGVGCYVWRPDKQGIRIVKPGSQAKRVYSDKLGAHEGKTTNNINDRSVDTNTDTD